MGTELVTKPGVPSGVAYEEGSSIAAAWSLSSLGTKLEHSGTREYPDETLKIMSVSILGKGNNDSH